MNNNTLKPCSPACLTRVLFATKGDGGGGGGQAGEGGRLVWTPGGGVLKLTHAITKQMSGAIAISTFIECGERWPSEIDDLAYHGGLWRWTRRNSSDFAVQENAEGPLHGAWRVQWMFERDQEFKQTALHTH